MEPSQYASFLSSNDIIKSDSDTVNVSRSTLARFPSLLLSRKRGTALVVRSSDVDPTEPSVQMSWTGEETHSSRAPAVALPPSYDEARIPTTPVVYTFTQEVENPCRLRLLPPSSSPDTRASFYMSVAPDPWVPWVWKTTLSRDPSGQFPIGELRYGNGKEAATVTFRGTTMPFTKVVTKSEDFPQDMRNGWSLNELFLWPRRNVYVWEFDGDRKNRILWTSEIANPDVMRCYHWSASSTMLVPDPTKLVAEVATIVDKVTLKLWPAGHDPELWDHIVLSAVVVRSYAESGHKLRPQW